MYCVWILIAPPPPLIAKRYWLRVINDSWIKIPRVYVGFINALSLSLSTYWEYANIHSDEYHSFPFFICAETIFVDTVWQICNINGSPSQTLIWFNMKWNYICLSSPEDGDSSEKHILRMRHGCVLCGVQPPNTNLPLPSTTASILRPRRCPRRSNSYVPLFLFIILYPSSSVLPP